MHNLITHPLSPLQIAAVLRQATPAPLLPPQGSPAWAEVAARPSLKPWIERLRVQAEAERGQSLPELTDELYARFRGDGNRNAFQAPYFDRRNRLGRAALCALLFPGEAQWLEETVRVARGIMEETSWALPAHIGSPTGKDPDCIDLFSAETAEEFGSLVILFGGALPTDLVQSIKTRVRTQTVDNFRNAYSAAENRPATAHWVKGPGNWNAVCHQGVMGATLYMAEDADVVADVLHKTAHDLTYYLASFTSDGGCSEGPGYWNYGFGRFSWLNQQIETYTHGALSLMDGNPLLREIAAFARRLSIEGGRMINFADCVAFGMPDAALSAYLGERLQDAASRQQAQISYAHALTKPIGDRLFGLLRFALYCPPQVEAAAHPATEDWYYPDLGVIIAGGSDPRHRMVFAAKGGHNSELHNHNDCGSFVFYQNGAAMASEIGAPEYTRQLFGPERYTQLATGSFGHSVPVINGCQQPAGLRYAARVLNSELSPTEARFALDLTGAYPDEADCAQAQRTFLFDKINLSLHITDTFVLTQARSLETAIITEAEATMQPDGSALIRINDQLMHLVPTPGTTISVIQTHTYSNQAGQPQSIRRLVLTPDNLTLSVTLAYTLLPE